MRDCHHEYLILPNLVNDSIRESLHLTATRVPADWMPRSGMALNFTGRRPHFLKKRRS
jgi:hypothetical protein